MWKRLPSQPLGLQIKALGLLMQAQKARLKTLLPQRRRVRT